MKIDSLEAEIVRSATDDETKKTQLLDVVIASIIYR